MKKLGIIYAPRASSSAAALARLVPMYRVDTGGFKSRAGERRYIQGLPFLNWGGTGGMLLEQRQGKLDCVLLNHREATRSAVSKLKTLTILKEAGIPALEATGEAIVAQQWIDEGPTKVVLARRDGLSGGRGIRKLMAETITSDIVQSTDFYVRYFKKTHEYRVHVFNGTVIDIQQKRRRTNWEGTYDPMIRNFDNGWVFCHDNLRGTDQELATIRSTAQQAVAALGLDFGAVDVLARFQDGTLRKHVVCEINTAPGLEGQTLTKYVEAIRGYLHGL